MISNEIELKDKKQANIRLLSFEKNHSSRKKKISGFENRKYDFTENE